MSDLKFVDAISLANAQSAGPADGTAFYLPGGDAFRAWPLAEVQGITTRYRLPIFVRSNPALTVLPGDAEKLLSELAAYGVPKGTLVCLDSETSVDPTYVRGLWASVHAAGYKLIDYGSQSVVFGTGNPDSYYWGADWTNTPHIHAGDGATQWRSLGNYDVSAFRSALPLWDTRPITPPPPPVGVSSVPVPLRLPEITLGMADPHLPHWYIQGRIQPILNATWKAGLTVDGVYGPKTQAAVERLQRQYGIANELGRIGPVTWTILLQGSR